MNTRYPKRKDFDKLYLKARRILKRELSKPSEEWDEALISECEETMLFCAQRGKALRSESGSENAKAMPPALRRALFITLAVIASLLIFATVAQAAGLRIWSAIVHWDPKFLSISYNDNAPNDPPIGEAVQGTHPPVVESDEEYALLEFFSSAELKDHLGSTVLWPDEELDECLTISRVTDSEDMVTVYSEYSVSGRDLFITYIHSRLGFSEGSYSVTFSDFSEYASVVEKDIDGVSCVIGEGVGKSICTFRYENTFYSIRGDFPAEELERIAAGMLERR